MAIPEMPMFNTPETFGRALSYEGQIHAVLGWYDENADYVNDVRADIDHAVESLDTLDGLMEQAQVAIPAATDAASAANTATGLANAATSRANTATGNANTAATRADNAAESIESYPLVVAERMVNPGTAQFLDFGNLAVSGDSTKDGVTVEVDGTGLSFSGSNTQGSVFFNFHPDNAIGFHPNTVYHAWMDVVPHDSISRPIDVVLILFGYDSDLQQNTEIVRVGTRSTGRKEFSFVDPVGYELYTITVYIGTNKTDMTVVPHFDAVMDNALLSEAETSILSTGISWLSDTLHEGPDVVSTADYTIFRPEWGTRVDVVGTFASDYEYRIRFDDYYRYIEHDRTYLYRLDGRIPFTASILGISGNGLVQEEETILDAVTNVPGNPAYGTFHIPDYDYDWYDLVYTIPAGTYATNRSIDLRFGTVPDNVYLKRLIDSISTDSILDGSVTTPKLSDGAVTTVKVDDGAVTTAKIADGAVTEAKLSDGAVTNAKIAAGNVTSDKLASNSVITAKVADGAVTTAKIADGAVTNAKIADGHVNGAKIADGSITTSKLAANSVATADIIDANVTAQKLASSAVTTAKVADGAVTADKLASNAVTTAKVSDGAVTSDKLASNAVTTAKVANGAVTADKLASDSVANGKIADGAVDAFKLANESVTYYKLDDDLRIGYVRSFDTVADMQAATDLESGTTCHTNGFHASGDGGAAYYTMSTSGTANGMDVLACSNGLKAHLVATGPYVTPEMFGAYGDGTHDDTESIRRALSAGVPCIAFSGGTYLVDVAGSSQSDTTQGIAVPSNTVVDLGCSVLKVIPNSSEYYSVFTLYNVDNVKICNGSVLGDKDDHTYNESGTDEWGMGITVINSHNVTIDNVAILDTTGDGVLIGDWFGESETAFCHDVTIDNCVIDGVRRNGVTVTSGSYISVENTSIKNVNGTSPQFAICVEPNSTDNLIKCVFVSGCYISNCTGGGVNIWMGDDVYVSNNRIEASKDSQPISVVGSPSSGHANLGIVVTDNVITCEKYGYIILGSNCIWENNHIDHSRITLTESNMLNVRNMLFSGNVCTHCYFDTAYGNGNYTVVCENASITDNIFKVDVTDYTDGESNRITHFEFGMPNPDGTGKKISGIVIRDNTFEYSDPGEWASGTGTPYNMSLGIIDGDFSGNELRNFPYCVEVGISSKGMRISGNRFIDCCLKWNYTVLNMYNTSGNCIEVSDNYFYYGSNVSITRLIYADGKSDIIGNTLDGSATVTYFVYAKDGAHILLRDNNPGSVSTFFGATSNSGLAVKNDMVCGLSGTSNAFTTTTGSAYFVSITSGSSCNFYYVNNSAGNAYIKTLVSQLSTVTLTASGAVITSSGVTHNLNVFRMD